MSNTTHAADARSTKLVMASVVMATLIASMDTTITNTTMPVVAAELGESGALYSWTFASYMIFSTVLAPLAGRISDMFGRKRIFGVGILLFLFGSLLCGLADSMLQLVIYRAVQGIGAGIMMPFPIIIAGDLFSVDKRGKIQALFTGMWGLSSLLAPLLGSVFVEQLDWRWIFYINVPICILCYVLLRNYKEVYKPKRAQIDYYGSVLFAAGISLLLAATTAEGGQLILAAAGTIVMILFYLYERRHPSPIVPLGLLANKPIRYMIINSFAVCCALFGTSSYIPLFLQHEGYNIFTSGLALLGMSIGWMITAIPAGKWVLRYGYPRLLVIGNATCLLSAALLTALGPNTGFWYVTAALFVQGAGFGMLFTVSTIGSQELVEPDQKGVSSSLQMFARNIGTAIGITIMGSLLYRNADFMTGVSNAFLFCLIATAVASLTVFLIRAPRHSAQNAGSGQTSS